MFFIVEMKRRAIVTQSETRDEAQKLLIELLNAVRRDNKLHVVNYQILEADSAEEIQDDLEIY